MFKKSMAALAVLSLSAGLASASEVTLYGIVDNGLLYKHSKVETNGVSTKTDSFVRASTKVERFFSQSGTIAAAHGTAYGP